METLPPDNPYQAPSIPEVVDEESGTAVLRDPRGLGRALVILLSVSSVCSLWYGFLPAGSLKAEPLRNVNIFAAIMMALVYFFWIGRCVGNVLRLNPAADISPSWAIICHFVPFANWVMPCQILRRIAKETFLHQPAGGLGIWIIVWWGSFLMKFFSGGSSNSISWAFVWLGSLLIFWISTIVVVTRISRRQARFRWSDIPESHRPAVVAFPSPRMTPEARVGPGGIPKRVVYNPISYAEQVKAEEKRAGAEE